MFGSTLTRVFGSRNDRLVKRYRKIVAQVNAFEPKVIGLTDAQLAERTQTLKTELTHQKLKMADVLPEALAIVREAMDRAIGIREIFNPENTFDPNLLKGDAAFDAFAKVEDRIIQGVADWRTVPIDPSIYKAVKEAYPDSRPPFRARCFDVQLIGGLVMYENKIAEMATGEGKTFVAPLACFLRALEGYRCHVVTVNDYLVRRDATWIQPAFAALGLSVGFIQQDMDPGGDARRRMYECDVTYGTNSEFGFDYLRDNMKERADLQVQGPLDFAIVDEVDSILIDEARTPLIISGSTQDDPRKYAQADAVARVVIEKHKPYAAVEIECDHWKRSIKAAQGDMDKARTKEEKAAVAAREKEAVEKLAEVEAKKAGLVQYYEIEMDKKSVHLTHEGIAAAQDAAGVGSFYVGENVEWPHLMEQAMRAHVVYERDRDYVVEVGTGPRSTGELEVVIVDEYTGRKMAGRQWSDGLHQACEVKERVKIKEETQTMATITLQNFFKLYKFLGGMTGTAQTESEEFNKIYKLEVVTIPTNRDRIREDADDRVYRTEPEKWEQMIDEIKLYSDAGRPCLVGTTSVDKSERISRALTQKYGIKHEVLNAKQHEREANIVAVAGQTHRNNHGDIVGNVTIATNMAGRGTDIKLVPEAQWDVTARAPDPADKKVDLYQLKRRGTGDEIAVRDDSDLAFIYQLSPQSKAVGGLHVIGTERHTSRRIDNQLRGRSGRQGDPGSSRFYSSLEDDLLKMFMPEWTVNVFKKIGMAYGEAIESGMLTRSIERAQKKVEERNYLARKNLLEYDEVMDVQRNEFYGMRQRVLEGRDIDQVIWKMIHEAIEDAATKYVTDDYVSSVVAEWARNEFEVNFEASEFKGMTRFQDLEESIKNVARNEIMTTLPQTIGEYLGEDRTDSSQWHVKDIVNWARTKHGVVMTESQVRQMDGHELEEKIKDAALAQVARHDVAQLTRFIEPQYAAREFCNWAEEKFSIELDPEELLLDAKRDDFKPAEEIVDLISGRAQASYKRREIEHPIDHTLQTIFNEAQTAEDQYGIDYLRNWARAKYATDVPAEQITGKSIREIRALLIPMQERALTDASIDAETDRLLAGNPSLDELVNRWQSRFQMRIDPKLLDPASAGSAKGLRPDTDAPAFDQRTLVRHRVRGIYRFELTALEQYVLVSIFDQSWKDHLYAMDMLKGGIGLQAFAEKDPRVAYKREGYRFFREMMSGIREKVTGIIFRVNTNGREQQPTSNYNTTQQSGPSEDGNYDVGSNARETATAVGGVSGGGDQAIEPAGDETDALAAATSTIVRNQPKVGRNDPCPCGSGEKFKRCHGKTTA